MKLKALILLLSLSTLSIANAQSDSTVNTNKKFYLQNQVGFNASNFIKQFMSFNSSTIVTPSPFDFNYKLLAGSRSLPSLLVGLRTGVGYNNTHSSSTIESNGTSRKSDNTNFVWRIGIECQQKINKHWSIYYGIDYIKNNSENSTSSINNWGSPTSPLLVTTKTSNTNKTNGWGPIIGIQFKINKRICLGTEASFYMTQSSGESKSETIDPNNIFNNSDSKTSTDSKSTTIITPAFINFNIIF